MLHAKVTAHKGILVLELLAEKSIENEVVTTLDTPSTIGQVIMDTGAHLGVSAEALELLKGIKRGHDDLGDVDWFSASDGEAVFGWLGGPKRLCNPTKIEGSSSYSASLPHVLIPNDVPEGARECIDNNPPA